MTDSYGPFDDSPWAEAQWFDYAPVWAVSGVIGVPAASATAGSLAFSSSGLSVSAGTGKAWVKGAGFKRTGTPPSQVVTANTHASLFRRDRLVLRRDLTTHNVTTVLLEGSASASPTAPDLTQTDLTWDLRLFSFLVPPNSGTTITGVVDERVWIDPDGGGLIGPWASYPVAWTATDVATAVNNGTLVGRYRKTGRHVDIDIFLKFGSTTGGGTGDWRFSLPFPAAADREHYFSVKAFTAAGDFVGMAYAVPGGDMVFPYLPASSATSRLGIARNAAPGGAVGTGVPIVGGAYTFQPGHNLAITGRYETAS